MNEIKYAATIALAAIVVCVPDSWGAAAAKTSSRPNVVVILADDMGYGDASCYNSKDIPTPHIDSIARNGVRFTAGYVTAPQCAPSRSGLLSGRDQNRFNCGENYHLDRHGIPRDIKLFGDFLRPAGYQTGLVGKWHLGAMAGCHPLERGFDEFFGFLGGGSLYFPAAPAASIVNIFEGRSRVQVSNYLTTEFGARAVRFVDEHKGHPFFLYLAFNAPHEPLQAPAEYVEKFKHLAIEGEPGKICGYTKQPIKHPHQVYAAMVAAMDDEVGRVLASLRRNGLEQNTIVIFLSDNGGPTPNSTASNGPLRGVKGDVLEGGIRVPFVMQWKSMIPAGQTVDMPVSSLDLLPTVLAAAGATGTADARLDGMNLLPVLTGTSRPQIRTLYWLFPFPSPRPERYAWAIRHGDWKLVRESVRDEDPRFAFGTDRTGLYNLQEDIAEKTDLSVREGGKRRDLQAAHDAWRATLPVPSTESRPPRK